MKRLKSDVHVVLEPDPRVKFVGRNSESMVRPCSEYVAVATLPGRHKSPNKAKVKHRQLDRYDVVRPMACGFCENGMAGLC